MLGNPYKKWTNNNEANFPLLSHIRFSFVARILLIIPTTQPHNETFTYAIKSPCITIKTLKISY